MPITTTTAPDPHRTQRGDVPFQALHGPDLPRQFPSLYSQIA